MSLISRRTFLQGSAALGGAFAFGAGMAARAGAAPDPQVLTAQLTQAQIASDGVTPKVMTYGLGDATTNGMPPVLRMRMGEPYAARLINKLDEPTTVHWHGLRIPNAMDGVPEMTQPYVYPGDPFDYIFKVPGGRARARRRDRQRRAVPVVRERDEVRLTVLARRRDHRSTS